MPLVRCMICADRWSTSAIKFQRDGVTRESWPVCVECSIWFLQEQRGTKAEERTVTLHPKK